MADADETLGEQMEEKAAQEFIERQRHQLLLIMVSGVAPTKGHLAVVERNQSVVGDGYAVGITAEVVEHILTTLTYDRNSIGFQDHKGKALPSGRALC